MGHLAGVESRVGTGDAEVAYVVEDDARTQVSKRGALQVVRLLPRLILDPWLR
jgi:hypothetical protein